MEEAYVTIEDLARYFKVSVSTIRVWLRQKYIPEHSYLRVGNTYRFKISEVEAALLAKRQEEKKAALDEVAESQHQTNSDPRQLELNFNADEDI